eukprot:580119-Hanusia_phi.AAC.4
MRREERQGGGRTECREIQERREEVEKGEERSGGRERRGEKERGEEGEGERREGVPDAFAAKDAGATLMSPLTKNEESILQVEEDRFFALILPPPPPAAFLAVAIDLCDCDATGRNT